VHADDVAQAFERAVEMPERAIAESFHVVSEKALTLRGYAEAMSAWFGQAPRLRFLPWAEWTNTVSEREAAYTWDHIAHSPNCSIEKARTKLGYSPGYTSLEAVQESVSDSRPL
jgi:nucleoside-diphosphate-sugar epimerase